MENGLGGVSVFICTLDVLIEVDKIEDRGVGGWVEIHHGFVCVLVVNW
jgi:hypothetical protein